MRAPQVTDMLTPLARRLFEQTPGAGAPSEAADAPADRWRRGAAGARAAGVQVVVYLALDLQCCVQALRWQAWGCPHVIATLGWLAEQWIGRPLADAPAGGPAGWATALGVPIEKLGRLLLIEDAVSACQIRDPVVAGTADAAPGPT